MLAGVGQGLLSDAVEGQLLLGAQIDLFPNHLKFGCFNRLDPLARLTDQGLQGRHQPEVFEHQGAQIAVDLAHPGDGLIHHGPQAFQTLQLSGIIGLGSVSFQVAGDGQQSSARSRRAGPGRCAGAPPPVSG